ncbi:hypothetical protein RRU01S_28_00130 [Agrobacterium rubi TR3 = NBRC 13261]|uniref:Mobilization protein n=1 Tax=Agrobacterium rubi TR3 = NBRC 13261 TaxID=1368415 RepID=A0A081D1H4_9HYPH|nr:mobilization protein [Agrobacterium rubi]MBP1881281.1 glycogen debranching enzyme [Agrobacterium rubi]GAK72770.1 hypothetical protein RRU01S_28_00130 [Agrobacterium rubi TR3 = NBRC 13261]
MRKPIAQRIKELEERKRALQSRLGKQERAQETRRKIVLGSFVLERLAQDDDTTGQCDLRQWLAAQLPAFLVRDADRALFADLIEQCRMGQGHGVADGNAQQSTEHLQQTNGNQADVIGDNEP